MRELWLAWALYYVLLIIVHFWDRRRRDGRGVCFLCSSFGLICHLTCVPMLGIIIILSVNRKQTTYYFPPGAYGLLVVFPFSVYFYKDFCLSSQDLLSFVPCIFPYHLLSFCLSLLSSSCFFRRSLCSNMVPFSLTSFNWGFPTFLWQLCIPVFFSSSTVRVYLSILCGFCIDTNPTSRPGAPGYFV